MAVSWSCDICKKKTNVNPPTELIFDEVEEIVKVPNTVETKAKNGKMVKTVEFTESKITRKSPRIAYMKSQDPVTRKMVDIPIQATRDLEPRAYLVRLSIGSESIQKDFCKECLDTILPDLKSVFNKLNTIEDN